MFILDNNDTPLLSVSDYLRDLCPGIKTPLLTDVYHACSTVPGAPGLSTHEIAEKLGQHHGNVAPIVTALRRKGALRYQDGANAKNAVYKRVELVDIRNQPPQPDLVCRQSNEEQPETGADVAMSLLDLPGLRTVALDALEEIVSRAANVDISDISTERLLQELSRRLQ
jgi:transposase